MLVTFALCRDMRKGLTLDGTKNRVPISGKKVAAVFSTNDVKARTPCTNNKAVEDSLAGGPLFVPRT